MQSLRKIALVRFINAPRQVSVSDVSNASAIALCNSLEKRFAPTLEKLSVGISRS